MADPYTTAADALKTIIDAEFEDLNVAAIHDNIHESLGAEDRVVGIAPLRDAPYSGSGVAGDLQIEVRFYDFYMLDVDPTQAVDPRTITTYADRLKRALSGQAAVLDPASNDTWFFNWQGTDYPDDPTGNKSRFHMRISAVGDNTSLVETRG